MSVVSLTLFRPTYKSPLPHGYAFPQIGPPKRLANSDRPWAYRRRNTPSVSLYFQLHKKIFLSIIREYCKSDPHVTFCVKIAYLICLVSYLWKYNDYLKRILMSILFSMTFLRDSQDTNRKFKIFYKLHNNHVHKWLIR